MRDYKAEYQRSDKEKQRIYLAAWHVANPEYAKKKQATPLYKFWQNRTNARHRGISWELTFDEWWSIWQESGQWDKRGYKEGQYCLCRYGDTGPYSKNNVRVDTTTANKKERWLMTNTRRKNPLEDARNPVHNRIRYQRRIQEEREAERELKEELKRQEKDKSN